MDPLSLDPPMLVRGLSARSGSCSGSAHDAGLDHRQGPDGSDGLGQALEPVADRDSDVLDAAVFDFGQHREPELCPFAAVFCPQPEDIPATIDAGAERDVDRPVRDLPVADLDADSIDEHHRVDPVQGPVLPFGHLR